MSTAKTFIFVVKNCIKPHTIRLSFTLAKANFKLRNEGSYLGVLWYLLNPLALFFTILIVRKTAFSHSEITMYPVYLLIGLVIMGYLNRAIGISADIIRGNSGFIKSIQVPSEVLVLSTMIHLFLLHIFEIFLIVGLGLYFDVPLFGIVLYVASVALFTLFLLGLAFSFSTIGVFVSDIANLWSICSQFIFFITPTFYSLQEGTFIYLVNQFNPLYYFMTLSREALIFGTASVQVMFFACIYTMVSVGIGLYIFSKYRIKFAELL